MASTSKSPASRGKRKGRTLAFPVEFRLRIVKLYLEEGHSPKNCDGLMPKSLCKILLIRLIQQWFDYSKPAMEKGRS